MMRLMIAGTGSGSGKTTVTCAILAALKNRGQNIVSLKCGPDYIDPMFHKTATQVESRNLDLFLMGEDAVRDSLSRSMQNHDLAVIEGVMGLYDGLGQTDQYSSNHLSLATQTPVILVVNARGKALSLCAEVKGFLEFETNRVVGVILNNVNAKSYSFYRDMLETQLKVGVFGFLPHLPEAEIASRHLGLITADEISDLRKKIDLLALQAEQTLDLDAILNVANQAPELENTGKFRPSDNTVDQPVRLYVSRDGAFCFYYEDNHELLERLGASLHFFSPLHDEEIPDDADGIIFWGGYPELYAGELADNTAMKNSIRCHFERGVPIYAECGGYIYLLKSLTDAEGTRHDMTGIIPGEAAMTGRLQKFGYVELTANCKNLLCQKGETIRGHSFHYSQSTDEGNVFTATRVSRGDTWPCIMATEQLFAGYPHLHFGSNPEFAVNLVKACRQYRRNQGS